MVVAGGEAGNCPWELSGVTVEVTAVTLMLGESGFEEFCHGQWLPRALAVTVPSGALAGDAQVRVVQPWGEEEAAAVLADRPDPGPLGVAGADHA